MAERYRVLRGVNYGADDRRAEPGDIVDDIPTTAVAFLRDEGAIEHIEHIPAAGEDDDQPGDSGKEE